MISKQVEIFNTLAMTIYGYILYTRYEEGGILDMNIIEKLLRELLGDKITYCTN